ncbi:MAG: FkbM family methyltransferase [Chloroflexota bacterium]
MTTPLIPRRVRATPPIAHDPQRGRVPLPPILVAFGRVCFAWLRNQYGMRDLRPLGVYLTRTADFLGLARSQPVVEAAMGSLSVLVSTADRTIARSVYTSGDWDPLVVGTCFRALDEFGSPFRGSTFLEIGANFGVYSLRAVADYGFARAVAYEPDPQSFQLLEQNISRNGLADRVSAHHAALSSTPGELTLQLGSRNAGDNRITASIAGDGETVRVPARTLDDDVAAGHLDPADIGLAWLDVQGHEYEVLLGADSLLESNAALVVEYDTGFMDEATRLGLERLLAAHYDVMVDLGWCALTNRVRFQPAAAVARLAADGRHVETDLLLLKLPN